MDSDNEQCVRTFMDAMARADLEPFFDAMADDVSWRWMGVQKWSKTFEGKRSVVDELFSGAGEALNDSFGVQVHQIIAEGDHVVVEHTGRNTTPDGREYNNNYCWVLTFAGGLVREVREYMDTQLVTDTFGDPS
jgi:ketosteroid isomerase-like protein